MPDTTREVVPSRAAILPTWALAIVAIAGARTIIGLVLYLAADSPLLAAPLPHWLYAVLSCTMTAVGLALILGNHLDIRAAWLGGIFVLIGAPLATPLLRPVPWMFYVRPEAFTPALFWAFVARFPNDLTGRAGRIVRGVTWFAASGALVFFVANLTAIWSRDDGRFQLVFGRFYWAAIMLFGAIGLGVLLARGWRAEGAARRQVRIFIGGLLLGIAPSLAEVLIEGVWPAYEALVHTPAIEPRVGAIIFGALLIVPFVTAYSVLFDRVVEVRVVLRAAIQHALARYTIIAATLVPFAALTIFLFRHREEQLVALVGGPRPVILSAFVALGIVALRLRGDWLDRLDRRYFREAYDAREILSRVVGESPPKSAAELADRLRLETSRALHAAVEIFLVDDKRLALRHADGRLPALSMKATLVTLALGDSRPMDIDLTDPSSPLSRIPIEERHWLGRGDFRLLVGIKQAGGGAAGLIALAPKQSGLPYSTDDRRLLATVASTAGFALDSLRLASSPDSASSTAARECLACSRISPSDVESCECGANLVEAAVPHMLRGVFRIEQRIGRGGMGVVYRAADINLRRDVAIKALPHVTPMALAQLRREARAMAAVMHPNLAVIYAIETWQDTAFLVQEYLAGGTMAQRMDASRLPIEDVLDLGMTLADVLHHLHGSGIIHCDIKPSNIGFTQYGTVKLLDFGLARVLNSTAPTAPMTLSSGIVAERAGTLFGTPPYMAPEAIIGGRPAPAWDLWALSVVLFEAIAGDRPFDERDAAAILLRIVGGPPIDLRRVRPDAPPVLAAFFDRALARDPERRPLDAAAFRAELHDVRASL